MNMRRISILLVLAFCLSVTVHAQGSGVLLTDAADLLSSSEEAALLSELERVSSETRLDIVVVTVDSLDGAYIRDYADDWFDYGGYGPDGILLLVDMGSREWYISTAGYGITAITDAGLEYIAEEFVSHLSDGEYYQGFLSYTELCEAFILQARSGDPYDVHNLPKDPFPAVRNLLISLLAGFVIAWIVVQTMAGQLKSVRSRTQAREYVRENSMQLTQSRDMFLYAQVSRHARPKNNGGSSTHRSSSGRSHGGGGGRF